MRLRFIYEERGASLATDRENIVTRKHFTKLAEMVRNEKNWGGDPATLAVVAESLATICKESNPNFSRDKFLEACGMPNGEWAI